MSSSTAAVRSTFRPLPQPRRGAAPVLAPSALDPAHRAAEERLLVARLLVNDVAAWRRFASDYAPVVLGCIRRVLSRFSRVTDDHDVDEVYARFCCDLVQGDRRKLRCFDPSKGSRLSTWLGMLASNATYDYLRRIKRDRLCDPMPEHDCLPTSEASPFEQVQLRQRAALAAEVLDSLSERDREFVELYFGEGLEPEVIAERMGISVKTVYTKKHKITARLERLTVDRVAG
jgi:RNA polymerase sigma-70 factor (ECF subfamily)